MKKIEIALKKNNDKSKIDGILKTPVPIFRNPIGFAPSHPKSGHSSEFTDNRLELETNYVREEKKFIKNGFLTKIGRNKPTKYLFFFVI